MQMSKELAAQLGADNGYDFYCCYDCGRLITAPRMRKALWSDGRACRCGSMRVKPTDIKWYHWFKPSVLWFAVLRLRGIA